MKGGSRPTGGPEEFSRAGDSSHNHNSGHPHDAGRRADAANWLARSILLVSEPLGATYDEDLTVRLHAAAAVVLHVPGLCSAQRLEILERLPWAEAARRRWSA